MARGRLAAKWKCEIRCIEMVRQRDQAVSDVGKDRTCESGIQEADKRQPTHILKTHL